MSSEDTENCEKSPPQTNRCVNLRAQPPVVGVLAMARSIERLGEKSAERKALRTVFLLSGSGRLWYG
jgi:hypothetical protein